MTEATIGKNSKRGGIAMKLVRGLAAAAVFATAGITAVLVGGGTANAAVENGEKIAMYTKPAVVRVTAGCNGSFYWPRLQKTYEEEWLGLGSGFFISSNGYIATNAHVTEMAKFPDKCQEQLVYGLVRDVAQDYNLDLNAMSQAEAQQLLSIVLREARQISTAPENYVIIPNGSYLPYEIKTYGAVVGEGKDVSVIKIEVRNAPVLKIADSDKVRLQEHITVAGYPAAADTLKSGTLSKGSIVEASFTDGRVSARKQTADGAPVIQVSAPATHGNSGGPVLNDNGEVIGLLTFRGDTVYNQEVSGFIFAVASNTLMEFVRQAGTVNEQSAVDSAYRDGLNLFWNGKFQEAIAKFEEVRRLFPQHSEVEHLMRESQEQVTAGKGDNSAATPASGNADPVLLKDSQGAGAPTVGAQSPSEDRNATPSGAHGTSIWDLGTQPVGIGASVGLIAVAALAMVVTKRGARLGRNTARSQPAGCIRCGAAFRPGSRFCVGCGAPLEQQAAIAVN